jgi:predicted HAD superfamily Cof-like phosphohydrolase
MIFIYKMQSNYQAVKEFTEGASGQPCPSTPSKMTKDEVKFLLKMVLSELAEFAQTVSSSHDEAIQMLIECIGTDPSKQKTYNSDTEIIADQADALVDSWYYMLNAACKKGMDLSAVFDIVHKSNMAKRDPKTGTFIKRSDGKIMKPHGWKPADIVEEINRQMDNINIK